MTTALKTLLEHAEKQRDIALASVVQAEGQLREMHEQATQLLDYRDEYRQRHPAQGGRSASIELLRCHRDFMHRLDQAMQQQQMQVQQAQARCTRLRQVLLGHETRVASVLKLLQRREVKTQHHSTRLEQRRSDEAAMHQQRHREDVSHGAGWRQGMETQGLPH